jgi:hypothetical protein
VIDPKRANVKKVIVSSIKLITPKISNRHFSHLDRDTREEQVLYPLALNLCPEFLGKSKG